MNWNSLGISDYITRCGQVCSFHWDGFRGSQRERDGEVGGKERGSEGEREREGEGERERGRVRGREMGEEERE